MDEVHEFGSTKSIATLRTLGNTVWRLGFSATPFKESNDIRNMYLKACDALWWVRRAIR